MGFSSFISSKLVWYWFAKLNDLGGDNKIILFLAPEHTSLKENEMVTMAKCCKLLEKTRIF